ncbi:MAG: hypothetical protein K6B68_17360 [Eubacterium sp.]|nr:hypothetical protein [Eubacterium sp.]
MDDSPVSCGSDPYLWDYMSCTECDEYTGWTVFLSAGWETASGDYSDVVCNNRDPMYGFFSVVL